MKKEKKKKETQIFPWSSRVPKAGRHCWGGVVPAVSVSQPPAGTRGPNPGCAPELPGPGCGAPAVTAGLSPALLQNQNLPFLLPRSGAERDFEARRYKPVPRKKSCERGCFHYLFTNELHCYYCFQWRLNPQAIIELVYWRDCQVQWRGISRAFPRVYRLWGPGMYSLTLQLIIIMLHL